MSKSIRTFHSVLAATLMFSALSPSTVRAGANLCEVAFSETEKVGTSIVAVAANHNLISTNARRGSPLTTAERLLELQSALSLEERESIYNYIIAHPQMFFGRMGQAVADTVVMSVAAGPGKNRILSMRAAEILKWAPDKVATHKHLLDLDKRIFGESAFQILSDLSRRSYYDGETLRDLNGDRIIIEGSRVASKTKFLTNENAELFTRFFEWIVQKPERVQFAKLLLAEASPTFAAGMQRQVETPRGPFHKPVDLSAVETQLARSSALWKLKLKRFILIYGEETKVLVAVRKEQIRLARVAGLTPSKQTKAKPSLADATLSTKAIAAPKVLPEVVYKSAWYDLHLELSTLQLSDYAGDMTVIHNAAELTAVSDRLTRASLLVFPRLKAQVQQVQALSANVSQLNSHLSNYIMQVGLRGLEVSVEADGVASRKRSAVNAREDFEQLNSIAQNLLDQYRLVIERAPQGDRASAEAAVLRSTAQALQAVLANAVADSNAELEKVDREISATNLMLMTGSVTAIR